MYRSKIDHIVDHIKSNATLLFQRSEHEIESSQTPFVMLQPDAAPPVPIPVLIPVLDGVDAPKPEIAKKKRDSY